MLEYNGVFMLGYDLLANPLIENEIETDVAFEICYSVYTDFLGSEYNKASKSEYSCLEQYVRDNYDKIEALIKYY